MNAKAFDKSKLPSRHTTVGADRAPHRSYLYAMGLTEADVPRVLGGGSRGKRQRGEQGDEAISVLHG